MLQFFSFSIVDLQHDSDLLEDGSSRIQTAVSVTRQPENSYIRQRWDLG